MALAKTGGLVMKGRSDGVLKARGRAVRPGRDLQRADAPLPPTRSRTPSARGGADDGDETVCLFVVMKKKGGGPGGGAGGGFVRGDTDRRIRDAIRARLSPRHVPAVVDECGPAGVPRPASGKKGRGGRQADPERGGGEGERQRREPGGPGVVVQGLGGAQPLTGDGLGCWTVIIASIRESFPTGERRL